jgi:hypothetical protein
MKRFFLLLLIVVQLYGEIVDPVTDQKKVDTWCSKLEKIDDADLQLLQELLQNYKQFADLCNHDAGCLTSAEGRKQLKEIESKFKSINKKTFLKQQVKHFDELYKSKVRHVGFMVLSTLSEECLESIQSKLKKAQ